MTENKEFIIRLRDKVLAGDQVDTDEAYRLASLLPEHSALIRKAAAEITAKLCEPVFDSCSIVNARSGLCGEDCKWCAQSAHHTTSCETYDMIDRDECMATAHHNDACGIHRFSMVASGRAVKGRALDGICEMLGRVRKETHMETCASLGLIGDEEMARLKEVGVSRYHCNLETAPSHFVKLCTTHTIDDKMATIAAAHRAGLEVCSGGIIGMGETMEQRAEFALKLREARPVSIPVNILSPIPGTPLEHEAPITEDEIVDTVALFRFIHPTVQLRFAGGRRRVSRDSQLDAMRIGINGGIVGDLLTTIGSTVADDRRLAEEAGYKF